jgi:2-desacetyl-2-hydroxyethyl bacteriochlorophyllide A dehydrogenase
MKAVTFEGPFQVAVKDVPEPRIEQPTDVVIKVTTAAICGSDLHVYNGRMPFPFTGWVLGHEYVGIVQEVGEGVTNLRPGDRVVGSFVASCGECFFCRKGWPSQCPRQQILGFGMAPGAQAEYMRVPFGHFTLEKVPDGVPDEKAIFVGDILATGYFACEMGGIQPGDVVVVVGCGPVGLFAQMTASLFGPAAVIAIDSVPERLQLAQRLGSIAVDMGQQDPLAVVRQHTEGRGADVVIEAVGHQDSVKSCFSYVRGGGTISVVGVYSEPEFPFPLFQAFLRDISFRTGICPSKNYMARLLGLIAEGKLDPSVIVTHVLPLEEAPRGYEMFAQRREGCIKVLLKP